MCSSSSMMSDMDGIMGKAIFASMTGVVGVVAWEGSQVLFSDMSSLKASSSGSGIFCLRAGGFTGVFFTLTDVFRLAPRVLNRKGTPCV